MVHIYAIANQKGGVAKTTSTINLARFLAMAGKKVIVLDWDPQGDCTVACGENPNALKKHAYHLLIEDDVTVRDVLVFKPDRKFALIPTNVDLAGAEADFMMDKTLTPAVLRNKLDEVGEQTDFIIIDCPPSLGTLTVAALTAADGVLVPCQTHFLSYTGLYKLQDTIKKVKVRLNPKLKITAIFPTMYDARAKHDNEILDALRENYHDILIDIPVPMRAAARDSISSSLSLEELDPRSDATKAYKKIAEVILERS
jgi:chromosome partitioning protein